MILISSWGNVAFEISMVQGKAGCFGGRARGRKPRGRHKSLRGRPNSRLRNVGIKGPTTSDERVDDNLLGTDEGMMFIEGKRNGKGL